MSTKPSFFSTLPKWVQYGATGLAMAAVVVGLVFVFVSPGSHKTASPTQTDGPAIVTSPKPAPTQSQEEYLKSVGGASEGEGKDGGDALVDTSKESTFAVKAVQQWLTWNSTETAASRSARLVPFFTTDSGLLTKKPVTSNPVALGHKGAVTKTQIGSSGYASTVSADTTSITLDVTFRYISTAVYGGYTFRYSGSAVFRVDVPKGAPAGTKLDQIQEPSISF
ncbi:hypothetical protein GCM10025867_46850 (plasmid) [Frondihabitans sucicola]|uniref:LppX_LprAFG lipoprotein n=1 Tax=Frondihabitans sucicola TaxID=1268041 RepID=A0ABN6Y585_9MICO|nr:hypothetical protein [Frondihabitans sucicola]BDZ52444.1 hypothetical protein GCM10025867_46850 [Frondihabitans sucicola]